MFENKEMQAKVVPLVLKELKARGHEVAFKASEKLGRGSSIVVGEVRVPFAVNSARLGVGRRLGKATVRIDWLWFTSDHIHGSSVQMKARSFQQAKGREASLGFDIPKICDHIEAWASKWKKLKSEVGQKENLQEQWEGVVKLLRQTFPEESEKLKLKPTVKGIEVRGLFGHKDVEALLKALREAS